MPSMITSTAACDERSRSVSSMRRMKVPPVARAKAHGYSAERMLPRWMKPVGDGAKRVRTVGRSCQFKVLRGRDQGRSGYRARCSRPTATRIRPWPRRPPGVALRSGGRARCWPGGRTGSWCRPGWSTATASASESSTWKARARACVGIGRLDLERQHRAAAARLLRHAPVRAAGGCSGRGSSTRATAGMRSAATAPAPAPGRDCAAMRMSSVSRPLSTTQALKGASVMPPLLSTGRKVLVTSSSLAHRAPAITRPWPSRYLVPECMTMSAPKRHRALQRRRGKAVVDRQQRARVVREVGQRADVAHLGQRVGRRFGEQQLRVRA